MTATFQSLKTSVTGFRVVMERTPGARSMKRSFTGEAPGGSAIAASMAASRRWNRGCEVPPRERRARPAPNAPAHSPAVALASPLLTRRIHLAGTASAGAIATALALALGANEATGSEPYYEISATGGKDDRGTDVSISLDAALPIRWTGEDGTALFLQPGAVLLDGPGGRRLYGASLGVVYRLPTAGGVAGVNAFYDRNWAGNGAATRVHEQASLGVDYETGRHRLTANYYFPLSDANTWRVGATTLAEYAVGGPGLRYRLELNERWSVNVRTRYERDPGLDGAMGENAWRHAGGVEYRAGCLRIGTEPYRVSRRLQTLRDWSDEPFKQILPGAPGTGSAVGPGSPGRARNAMGGDRLGVVEGGVFGRDASQVGASGRARCGGSARADERGA